METYLNDYHKKSKDNLNINYQSNFSSSIKSSKNLSDINNNISQNKLKKNKSGLFLNNFFRSNSNTYNGKIYNSFKKSSNTINTIKNFKKNKKINVTPYQGVKNEYILSLAMDDLNKKQEDLLLKENNEQNWNEENLKKISINLGKDLNNNNYKNINYYASTNKNVFNKENQITRTMNKTQENFHPNNTINNYYKNFFINNDLFNKETNTEINKNNDSSEADSYKYLSSNFKNNMNSMNNRAKKSYNKETNNIDFDKNYEKKFNVFINKTFDLKNENEKQSNNAIYNNKKGYDKKLSFVLNNLELGELKEIFEKNFIFFDDLFLLSKDDFVEMKIPIGPRNRIINFIENYKSFGKSYDFEELSSFMQKYKKNLDNENNKDIFNFNINPSTIKKYKSNMTTENKKNKNKNSFDSRGTELLGNELNMSNIEKPVTISSREESKFKKYQNKKNVNKKNKIVEDINEIINNTKISSNIENNENISKIKEKYNNNSKVENNNNFNNENIFSNSLFNEYGSNNNNYNNNTNNINNLVNLDNANKNKRNKNISNYIIQNNSIKMENINNVFPINDINVNNYDSPSLNFINNKANNKANNPYKNFEKIFSEIEVYQMNYEKMKKENYDRNIKINNLLENKNKANLQNLKSKIKNSKYYNEEDLKNETVRDLKNELEKMNFQKENDNNELNSIKFNPSMQNYLKPRKNKITNNPLIEEFNKNK